MKRPKQGELFPLSLKTGGVGVTGVLILILFCLGCATSPSPEQAAGPDFPNQDYLTAMGSGKTQVDARRQAMAELSGIFESRVSSRFSSSSRSVSMEGGDGGNGGGNGEEVFEKETASGIRIDSDIRIQGARIGKFWKDEKTGVFHALAVLDRVKAGRVWASQVSSIDNEIRAEARALEGMQGRLARMAALNRIMGLSTRREVLESRLEVIDYPIEALTGVDLGAVAGERLALKSGLRVYIEIQGDNGDRAGELISRALSREGIVLVRVPGEANAHILGRIDISRLDLGNPNALFVRARGNVRIFDDQPQTIFAQVNENIRKGHKDIEEARHRAVDSLSAALSDGLLAALGYGKY